MTERHIYITETDLDRLEEIIQNQSPASQVLENELANAIVVPSTDIPPDVVTMNSRVVFEDVQSGARNTVTLVYPSRADASDGYISVLAPVGVALLGLRVGQTIDWAMPAGRVRQLRIVEVLYQPEASGDLHL
jgi:regulator of nucleoside diphosphate kinase